MGALRGCALELRARNIQLKLKNVAGLLGFVALLAMDYIPKTQTLNPVVYYKLEIHRKLV